MTTRRLGGVAGNQTCYRAIQNTTILVIYKEASLNQWPL